MILIKGFSFVILVCVERITFSNTCTCEDEILHLKEAIIRYSHNASKLGIPNSCGRVCKTTESDSSDSNGFDIIYIVVDDKTFPLKVSKNEKTVTITCGITTADCCNKSSSSTLENTTQQTTQSESTPTLEETTKTTELTSPATTFGENPSITTVSKESESKASIVCECPSNGLFAGAAFIGLFIGVLTTGSISFFLHKRWTSTNKRLALSNSLYELNETQASIRPTAGET
eukprot:XP_011425404.1 PREDICTED: uncharacterized protein LOC105326878 [Crassostrea gigas]